MLALRPFKYALAELIVNRRKQIPFWVLVGFLPTYIAARTLVATDPNLFVKVRGTHVHHFIWGVFVLAIVGFISLETDRWRRTQALFYGVGLALAFDEFGMWTKLTTDYNIDSSQDAMAVIFAILVFLVYGIGIIRRAWPHARRLARR
jgi:Na+/H+ antiporter NhaC